MASLSQSAAELGRQIQRVREEGAKLARMIGAWRSILDGLERMAGSAAAAAPAPAAKPAGRTAGRSKRKGGAGRKAAATAAAKGGAKVGAKGGAKRGAKVRFQTGVSPSGGDSTRAIILKALAEARESLRPIELAEIVRTASGTTAVRALRRVNTTLGRLRRARLVRGRKGRYSLVAEAAAK